MHFSRTNVEKNYITLGIKTDFQFNSSLERVRSYVAERLENLNVQLIINPLSPYSTAVYEGRAKAHESYPSHIQVKCQDARNIIDDLYNHNEMSKSLREELEEDLKKLERCAEIAKKCTATITLEQEALLQNTQSPHIALLRKEVSDKTTLQRWIEIVANAIWTIGSKQASTCIRELLHTAGQTDLDKTAPFYESLFYVAKVYAGRARLEEAFLSLATTHPSPAILKELIRDLCPFLTRWGGTERSGRFFSRVAKPADAGKALRHSSEKRPYSPCPRRQKGDWFYQRHLEWLPLCLHSPSRGPPGISG